MKKMIVSICNVAGAKILIFGSYLLKQKDLKCVYVLLMVFLYDQQ